jgi:16S rRNA (cytosine1402-N4)-methyltransferase
MDRQSGSLSARDLIEGSDIKELTRIFRDFGEERHAFPIAKAIVRARERGEKLESTSDLVALIRKTLPAPVQRKMGTHPARRIFQGLRIAVNGELDVLTEGLEGARKISRPGGIIVVISYHSLEDRIVKRTFLDWSKREVGQILIRRPVTPGEEEMERNRSSRSAKLRAFIISNTGSVAE